MKYYCRECDVLWEPIDLEPVLLYVVCPRCNNQELEVRKQKDIK